MLQHHHQHQPQSAGYFDYSQSPSPSSLTNADSLNTTPFSVKDILNMVNQTEAYEGGYGHLERYVGRLGAKRINSKVDYELIVTYTTIITIQFYIISKKD